MSLGLDHQMVVKALELLREEYDETPRLQHLVPSVDRKISWFKQRLYTEDLLNISGNHIGTVRTFIQEKFRNGSEVTWGSEIPLVGNWQPTAWSLERLACRVAAATLNDVKGLG